MTEQPGAGEQGFSPADPIKTDAQPIHSVASILDEAHQVVEVTIIKPGEARATIDGKPVTYTEEALKNSLSLWEGAACFADHFNKSVRNIAGVFFSPWYDDGVKAKLRFTDHPLYHMVARIVRDREAGLAVPDVGLSADIAVSGDVANSSFVVNEITGVISADIVFSPAAGGSFDRIVNSVMQELGIAEDQNGWHAAPDDAGAEQPLVPEKRVRDLQSAADRLRNQVRDQEAHITDLQGSLTEAVARYRDGLLQQHPEIPENLLHGSTVAEVDASLEQARAVVEKVKRHLAGKVPAGAPARQAIDISSMSPSEKISYGLKQRGIGA